MITCKLCNKSFRKITNSHLRDKHGSTRQEYLKLFPGADLTSKETRQAMGDSCRGKTYEERYGEEQGTLLRSRRSQDTKRQFEDVNQRILRKEKNWKGYEGISGCAWRGYKNGALTRNLEFDVDIEYIWELYISQKGICKLSGVPIEINQEIGNLNRYGSQRGTASLDRIDSKRGYIKGNLQWVHKDINRLKSNWPEEQFVKMCKQVAEYNRDRVF